ncbi:tetratricopeptide repeat protein [Bdellovibrio sp. 22V]|uniref:tetratricopeptide repeat protein n=1 Tax=Bdellovibrio TaxID=958 RepID=UPI002542D09B|nr:tetratricopeptide repeat protein [Bdellovibrio sp. 22V]WII72148.1 tetratricopeptide repeat protein [Bdellovibrio sp. 22V]
MENDWALKFKSLTENGHYSDAKELLSSVAPQTIAEKRTLGHFQSQIYFYEGDYKKALECARKTKTDFGPNIRLTGDITVYLYYLDSGPQYLKALEHFKNEYFAVLPKLSDESRFWATSNLAKLLEEQGDLALSIQLYSDLLKTDWSSERELSTKAHLLRCYATLGGHEKVASLYSEIFYSKAEKTSRFSKFEQEHALLLADLYLLGHKGAEIRLKQILLNPDFDQQEKSLSYYDFLDVLLMINSSASKEIHIPSELVPPPQFFFEKEISIIYENTLQDKPLPLPDLYHLKASRSPLDVLRILSHGSRSSDKDVAAFCRMQFTLLLESIPSASQKFWQRRLPRAQEGHLFLNILEKTLHFKSRSLDLKRSPKQVHMLEIFCSRSSWTSEELCNKLYGFSDGSSTFDRLRMLVRSLNENVRSLTGDSLLNLDEKGVHLRSEFILKNTPA